MVARLFCKAIAVDGQGRNGEEGRSGCGKESEKWWEKQAGSLAIRTPCVLRALDGLSDKTVLFDATVPIPVLHWRLLCRQHEHWFCKRRCCQSTIILNGMRNAAANHVLEGHVGAVTTTDLSCLK
jgi:hypothetical protein